MGYLSIEVNDPEDGENEDGYGIDKGLPHRDQMVELVVMKFRRGIWIHLFWHSEVPDRDEA